MKLLTLASTGIALVMLACGEAPRSATPEVEPTRLSVVQRQGVEVPGTDGRLILSLGDITRGRVHVSLTVRDATAPLVQRTLRRDQTANFVWDASPHQLIVADLVNRVVGDDVAILLIAPPIGAATSTRTDPTAEIEALLTRVADSGLTFVRGGSEYDSKKAAQHLRTKWKYAGSRIQTAEQFIEHIGSRSSTTGKPYHIKHPDGTTEEAGPWLERLLAEVRK